MEGFEMNAKRRNCEAFFQNLYLKMFYNFMSTANVPYYTSFFYYTIKSTANPTVKIDKTDYNMYYSCVILFVECLTIFYYNKWFH